jgi:large conductance mechanosensitive channel
VAASNNHDSKSKYIERREVTVPLPVIKAPGWLQGFITFVREQGVVGLGVGLVLGVAAKSVIDSLVVNIFNPILGLAGNGGDLSSKYVCLKTVAGQCTNKLGYGRFIGDVVSFMIVAAVVYFVVKGLKLDKLDKKKA